MSGAPVFAASVVIPTRNRDDELAALLGSLGAQSVPLDVLVMDDGASEATRRLVEERFPWAAYRSMGTGKGPAFQRNRGTELARSAIVFSVDDDTAFVSPRTIEQTLEEFDDPRVGAVGIPFINVRRDEAVLQRAKTSGSVEIVHAFVGAAHAVRRDVFLKVGGYREHFFYMGEEGDLCLRMLAAGYVTRIGNADPIHHLESPQRVTRRANRYGRRNDILFAWHNVPAPHLVPYLCMTTFNGVRWAIASRTFAGVAVGVLDGYREILRHWNDRRPVGEAAYRVHRRLKKGGPAPIDSARELTG
jgi:GT2 family glycosyltransferase